MACVTWCDTRDGEIPPKSDPDSELVAVELVAHLTNYAYDQLLKAFTLEQPTLPAVSFWVSAHSTESDATTPGTELSGNGYSRYQVSFTRASELIRYNGSRVNSPLASGSAWNIMSFGIWDAQTDGNRWAFGNIGGTLTIDVSEAISHPAETGIVITGVV